MLIFQAKKYRISEWCFVCLFWDQIRISKIFYSKVVFKWLVFSQMVYLTTDLNTWVTGNVWSQSAMGIKLVYIYKRVVKVDDDSRK